MDDRIRVWCDVGGTFTDCFVVTPDGARQATKVLSSGVVKGTIEQLIDARTILDPRRQTECDGFWDTSTFYLIDAEGHRVWQSLCVEHRPTPGSLRLADPLPISPDALPSPGWRYELATAYEAPVLAARLLLRTPVAKPLPPTSVRLGTTRGTNALLTRRGAKTAFLTTYGFKDLLRIGYQERPELFALTIHRREPIYESVVEIVERIDAGGQVLVPLDEQQVASELESLRRQGIQSLAIALMHSYRYPQHEIAIESLARRMGFVDISTSHRLAPMIKIVSRGETAVVDAYLGPVVRGYLERVAEQFGTANTSTLRVMTSHGGLVDHRLYHGKDSVLSGPAGGAVALAKLAAAAGYRQAIGLDMGGTSTDVCRIDGGPTIEYESIKAGVRLMTPVLAIHTVAAGGGSICDYDGIQWRVGPDSAGSDPGPACYGRHGPLTITDLNLLLGRLVSSSFPFPLDHQAANRRLRELAQRAGRAEDETSLALLAAGIRRLANEHMAGAVRKISIRQGADPRSHVLVGFGGAAGQHLCEIAELLKIETILDPPEAGMFSALGMGLSTITRWTTAGVYRLLSESSPTDLEAIFEKLEAECQQQLADEDIASREIVYLRSIELRYLKTEQSISMSWSAWSDIEDRFTSLHRQRFGYDRRGQSIEIVALRVEGMTRASTELPPVHAVDPKPSPSVAGSIRLFSGGEWHAGWSLNRQDLVPGQSLAGPGIVLSAGNTTVVDHGWRMEVLTDQTLKLTHDAAITSTLQRQRTSSSDLQSPDPLLRDIFAQRMAAIADSMGQVLEQTSMSVNIKERRDFSCAIFSAEGDLIANAPHVPVHLGAMSETVKRILERFPGMVPGDCFITNDPYCGGSHLPDVTVVTPVFDDDGTRILFTASRAHHAEIGGIAPGSMSPRTRRLEEEGVILPPMYLVREGRNCLDEVRNRLLTARYPTRSVEENLADIVAQQAANRRGEAYLLEVVREQGWPMVRRFIEQVFAVSEAKVIRWLDRHGSQVRHFSDRLDDGTPIHVQLAFGGHRLKVAFDGTGPVSTGNHNANPAIVTAAVLYFLRTLIDDEMPLNSGAMRPVDLQIPAGLLNPFQVDLPLTEQPAVAAGNVETSQRIVDCLLGALEVAGASQGTMNNLLMGNQRFGYYETIGGGSGGTADGPGTDAIHTHMTNTRLTDPEILETRYPVRLTRFEIRRGSGGKGLHPGGEGMHRELMMLEELEVSLVTGRRGDNRPYGMSGGEPGAAGENYRIDCEGHREILPAVCQLTVKPGERIGIKTPGGGGYGPPDTARRS